MMQEVVGFEKNLLDLNLPLSQSSNEPCLIHAINGKEELEQQIIYNIFGEEEYPCTEKVVTLSNKFVWSLCDGWWLIKDLTTCGFFLLNPLTMERISLPDLEFSFDSCLRGLLTSSPRDPDCRLIIFEDVAKSVFHYRIGDDKFTEQLLKLENELTAIIMFHGKIYGLELGDYRLVCFSFQEQTLIMTQMISGEEDRSSRLFTQGTFHYTEYLIECNGDLLHVHKNYCKNFAWEVSGFKIYKMNAISCEWEEVKSIGEQWALFLDDDNGMCCEVIIDHGEKGIRGNCIYFVDLQNHYINVFDLEDGSISSWSLFPSTVDANYTNHVFRWFRLSL